MFQVALSLSFERIELFSVLRTTPVTVMLSNQHCKLFTSFNCVNVCIYVCKPTAATCMHTFMLFDPGQQTFVFIFYMLLKL